jgi:preprotein translocase subunit SecG
MIEFLSVLHIIVTVALCGLVLIQDSKGGGALGIGGSGSNSLLGATGAQSLAANMTKWIAVLFATSCIALTYFLAHQNKSVVDQMNSAVMAPATTPTTETTPVTVPGAASANAEAAKPADVKESAPAPTTPAAAAPAAPEKK